MTLIEQITGRCRHYNGLAMNARCRAGVPYVAFNDGSANEGKTDGLIQILPCFAKNDERFGFEHYHCEHRDFPTIAEAQERERAMQERIKNMMRARQEIVAATFGERGIAGTIDCPICGTNKLHYGVAHNGHIHSACEKAGCIRWQE